MKTILLFAAIIFFTVSCGVKVSTTYDHAMDFSDYKTFCWLQGCEFTFTGPNYLNDSMVIEDIKVAIINELHDKGYVRDENDPDFLIDFHVTVEDKETMVYRYNEQFMDEEVPLPAEEVYYYREGTLVMDIVDKTSGRMVWRSHVRRYMENNPNPPPGHMKKGIIMALKDFPPK